MLGLGQAWGLQEEQRAAQLGTESLPGREAWAGANGQAEAALPAVRSRLGLAELRSLPVPWRFTLVAAASAAGVRIMQEFPEPPVARGMTVCFPTGPQPLRQLRAILSRREQICHGQRRWPGEGWGWGWAGGPCSEGAHLIVLCHSEQMDLPSQSPCCT